MKKKNDDWTMSRTQVLKHKKVKGLPIKLSRQKIGEISSLKDFLGGDIWSITKIVQWNKLKGNQYTIK